MIHLHQSHTGDAPRGNSGECGIGGVVEHEELWTKATARGTRHQGEEFDTPEGADNGAADRCKVRDSRREQREHEARLLRW
jgi:hypothetical protein